MNGPNGEPAASEGNWAQPDEIFLNKKAWLGLVNAEFKHPYTDNVTVVNTEEGEGPREEQGAKKSAK
jgi:hypothetical protein